MRQIKFRVWDKQFSKMIDIRLPKKYHTDWERFVLMQYTGLKDKNGKEIYEGDIVKNKKIGGDYHIGEIIISPTQGVVVGNWPIGFEKKTEVIGNIYENPELLEANK